MSLLLQITGFLHRKLKMVEQYGRELAVGVAAAAYVVNAIERDKAKYRIKIEGKKQDTISRERNSDRVSRRYSSKEVTTNTAGMVFINVSIFAGYNLWVGVILVKFGFFGFSKNLQFIKL